MKVVWLELALLDVKEIADRIAKDSPFYATMFIEKLFDQADILEDHPKMGRVVAEYERDDLREMIVSPYRLIYRNHPDRVSILAVIHGARELGKMDVTGREK